MEESTDEVLQSTEGATTLPSPEIIDKMLQEAVKLNLPQDQQITVATSAVTSDSVTPEVPATPPEKDPINLDPGKEYPLEERITVILKGVEAAVGYINEIYLSSGENYPKVALCDAAYILKLTQIHKSHYLLKDQELTVVKEYKRRYVEKLVECGGITPLVQGYRMLYVHGFQDKETEKLLVKNYNLMMKHLVPLWNMTDMSEKVSELVCNEGLLKFISDVILADLYNKHMATRSETNAGFRLLKGNLCVLYNSSRTGSNRDHYLDNNIIQSVERYKESWSEHIRCYFYLIAAYTLDEARSEQFLADPQGIGFILKTLGQAMKNKSRRYRGLETLELVQGVQRLSVNDSNKLTLVQEGAVPILVYILGSKYEDEVLAACGAIWNLAFHKENQQTIRDECLPKLRDLKDTSPNAEIVKQAKGTIWILDERSERITPPVTPENAPLSHIMISYQWDIQPMMKLLRNELREQGYNVWIDVDQMGGSTLEAMAQAVEKAEAVIIAMSRKYKESPNCRTEAEYAFQLRKTIIPLKAENHYKPDGWLGMILGTKLWFDFTHEYVFKGSIAKLLKELNVRLRRRSTSNLQREGSDSPDTSRGVLMSPPPTASANQSIVVGWNHVAVKSWLDEIGIKNDKLQLMTGEELIFLRDLRHEASDFYYNYLKNDLALNGLTELMKFTKALAKLR